MLALRRFFKEVKAAFPKFEGAILIGNFPESSLVRRVSWCPGFLDPRQLAIGTELISSRADIVLADLTGNWENLYQQGDFTTENISAIPDAATTAAGWFDGESVRNCSFSSASFTMSRSTPFRDAFYMDDAIYTIVENTTSPPRLRVTLQQAERNNEVAMEDRTLTNILARPDINISRINPYHVAVNPNPSLVGTDGNHFLDAAGNPQVVTSPTPLFDDTIEHIALFNFQDFDLERRMLIRYLDRNHRFRNGAFSNLPFRGSVVSGTTDFAPESYEGLVNAAAADFGPCVKTPDADLQQYVALRRPGGGAGRFLRASLDVALGHPPRRRREPDHPRRLRREQRRAVPDRHLCDRELRSMEQRRACLSGCLQLANSTPLSRYSRAAPFVDGSRDRVFHGPLVFPESPQPVAR